MKIISFIKLKRYDHISRFINITPSFLVDVYGGETIIKRLNLKIKRLYDFISRPITVTILRRSRIFDRVETFSIAEYFLVLWLKNLGSISRNQPPVSTALADFFYRSCPHIVKVSRVVVCCVDDKLSILVYKTIIIS